ncbi:MAG TPA: hypothetical protein VK604_15505 [Bryobacteraceae bacterium]|nr:hypothetical protein [Bryobacteraceae bacterium]
MEINRRDFIQGAVAGAVGTAATTVHAATAKKMIGMQIGAVSFVDEGVEPVLDVLQKNAYVNTLFVATFTYGRGIAGRQVPGQPLPDHGKHEYDTATFHGGSYTKIHPQYYKNTVIKDFRASDFGNYDVLESVLPAARKRGLKTICWFEDVFSGDVPHIDQVQEKDLHGRNAKTLCLNNPNYRNWLLGTVEDYARSYEIDGIMWGSERQGPFSNALGASHGGGRRDAGLVTCFCNFCQNKAKQRGISVERAQAGYLALEKFVAQSRKGVRPVDGYYVELWRLMLRYPELLAWEMLWTDSLRETYAALHGKVKEVKPSLGIGWHIWHNNSFNPIYRAEQDLAELSKYSDFLKIVIYHNCGGPRMVEYINHVGKTIYGDVPQQELLDFHYRVLNYGEKSIAEIRKNGFSADYVLREVKRARAGLTGAKTQLWPGLDIDIPTAKDESKSTPGGTRDVVLAAFNGGSDGVILSRKYSEMSLTNLKGAGSAIRQLGLAS